MKILDYKFKAFTLILILAILSLDTLAQDLSERPLPQFMFPGFTKGVSRMKRRNHLYFRS